MRLWLAVRLGGVLPAISIAQTGREDILQDDRHIERLFLALQAQTQDGSCGARPEFAGALDARIAALREKMETAENARLAAEKRKREAEAQMAGMPEEAKRVAKDTQARIDRELAELEQANKRSLMLMEEDLADRKKEEVHAAALLVKKELVNQAVDELAAQYRARLDAGESGAHQENLIDGFADNLETLS